MYNTVKRNFQRYVLQCTVFIQERLIARQTKLSFDVKLLYEFAGVSDTFSVCSIDMQDER